MGKWQYESDITPSTITITDLVKQDWVMRITPERKIEVNEDVEVTEAARKVLDAIQEMMDRSKQMNNETTYEMPSGWMQVLESEVDGKKVIRYTFTRERIGTNDIPVCFSEEPNVNG